MKFKAGVSLAGVKQHTFQAMSIADRVMVLLGFRGEITVTSANDGVHVPGSKHGTGDAFDIRIWDLTTHDVRLLFVQILGLVLNTLLSRGWQVILESDHIHAEYDPD